MQKAKTLEEYILVLEKARRYYHANMVANGDIPTMAQYYHGMYTAVDMCIIDLNELVKREEKQK